MLPLTFAAFVCALLSGALLLFGAAPFSGAVVKYCFALSAAVFAACLYCRSGNRPCVGWSRRHLAYRDIDLY